MTNGPRPAEHDERIEKLLAAMSFEEKLAQLQIRYHPDPDVAQSFVRAGIGAVFWPQGAAATNEMQRIAVEETRHGIPLLVGLDVVHGQRTIFPIPLAQASSFDPDVAELDGRVSAQEARSGGVTWTFAPMIDVSRDPRWGRVAEGFGEDTYLQSVFGMAKVLGYQGDSLASPSSIAACAKHYVAYGQAEGGRDYNTVDVSERRLRNVYLEPFRAVVQAGVASVMAALNTVSGRPMHAHRDLLTGVLKDEWGLSGPVVGDADAVVNLIAHGVAEDLHDALVQSLGAGLDIEMGGNVIDQHGNTDLLPTDLPSARVDDAVRRVLRLKAALGLFDNPYVDPAAELVASTADSRAAARWAAERSVVLLKNDGTLPLRGGPLKVLLVGPYAESRDHLGAWVMSFAEPSSESLADALRTIRGVEVTVTVLPGADFYDAKPESQEQVRRAAADHDIVLVAAGEPSSLSGEASSRSDLRLPGDQEALIHAVADTGVPFAVVLMSGRPLVTSGWIDRAPAVLMAWHLGTQAPAALARLLTGEVDPAGRLPMSFPRSAGQVPIYYDHENTGRPATTAGQLRQDEIDIGLVGPNNVDDRYTSKYRDLELGPQFSFGHGLSYTTFGYSELSVDPAEISVSALRSGQSFEVSVRVTNTGDRAGDEVTQLYIRDPIASTAQPVRRLRGFRRTHLDAQESASVTFQLGAEDLGFWTGRGTEFLVEPGRFELHIGGTLETTRRLDVRVQ